MKILIIGHSVEDHIHQNDLETVKAGGIYYSALGFSRIAATDDEIHLITALQKSNEHLFADVYSKDIKKHINWIDEIPKVHLIIHDSEERTECYENVSENLDIDYSMLNEFDGILINMITGYDITLEQLKKIRKYFKGIIYLDVHTLSRGIAEDKTRVFRQIPDFSDWASCLDLIQANEIEKKTFFTFQDESSIVSELFKLGVKVFIVTKGNAGSTAYHMPENKIELVNLSAENVEAITKVGCGDIFGSVFFYYYLKTKNVNYSLTAANYAAGQFASAESFTKGKLRY